MKDAVILDGKGVRHGKIDDKTHLVVEHGEEIPIKAKPPIVRQRPARQQPPKPTPQAPQGNILGHVAKAETVESGRNSQVLKK